VIVLRKFACFAILVAVLAGCSGKASSSPTSPTAATQPPPAVASPAPVVPTPEPTPTPQPPPVVVVSPDPQDRKNHPNVSKLEFVSIATLQGATLSMSDDRSSGAFWNDRRAITGWTVNNRSFVDDPSNEVAVFLGDKFGFVIVGTSVDHSVLSKGQGGFMYSLSAANSFHRTVTKTVHLTLAITKGLNYNSLAPDNSHELALSDPRILAFVTVTREINWRLPVQ